MNYAIDETTNSKLDMLVGGISIYHTARPGLCCIILCIEDSHKNSTVDCRTQICKVPYR